jgi:hypothetical protein
MNAKEQNNDLDNQINELNDMIKDLESKIQ